MSDWPALIAKVLAEPERDEPRLVLADWLTERGDPRGEFIALSCAPNTPHTQARLAELKALHHWAWCHELGVGELDTEFRRGFVERATLNSYWFEQAVERLFGSTPLRALSLHVNHAQAQRFVQLQFAPTLTSLSLTVVQHDTEAAAPLQLGQSSAWQRLVSFEFCGAHFETDDAALFTVGGLGALPQLRSLTISCRSADAVARALASGGFEQLTRLSLGALSLTNQGAEALAQGRNLERLERLDLGYTLALDEAGFEVLRRRFGPGVTWDDDL